MSGGQRTNAERQRRHRAAQASRGLREVRVALPALLVLDLDREAAARGISRGALMAEALAARKLHTAS